MAIHMGNTGFLHNSRRGLGLDYGDGTPVRPPDADDSGGFVGRALGLDYTGSLRRKLGCVTDMAQFGPCLSNLAARSGDYSFFVAGDSVPTVKAATDFVIRGNANATVLVSSGHPIHTGRMDHVPDPNRTHHSGHSAGVVKAMVDFLMLSAADIYVSNCPRGGSTFAWNVQNLRHGGPSFHGKEPGLCRQ
mmetsp:Transcript_28433/g.88180  ORF Transcript_28433/g.88180 Transcript_28433/m.88180 type:complete len:190 (+) Transcript_28433:674-1243(+)